MYNPIVCHWSNLDNLVEVVCERADASESDEDWKGRLQAIVANSWSNATPSDENGKQNPVSVAWIHDGNLVRFQVPRADVSQSDEDWRANVFAQIEQHWATRAPTGAPGQ